jgi:SAUR family protein
LRNQNLRRFEHINKLLVKTGEAQKSRAGCGSAAAIPFLLQSNLPALLYILILRPSGYSYQSKDASVEALLARRAAAMEEYQQVHQQGGRGSNKIRDIVRLQQLLKKWKKLATVTPSAASSGGRSSVPRGSFAVYVGEEMRRFVIPTEYLGHWAFADLLREAEEEFGFRHEGALRIPCDVDSFQGILRLVQQGQGGRRNEPAAMCDCDCSCSSETEILCR